MKKKEEESDDYVQITLDSLQEGDDEQPMIEQYTTEVISKQANIQKQLKNLRKKPNPIADLRQSVQRPLSILRNTS